MDSTVWDFTAWACEAVEYVTGDVPGYEDFTHWDYLPATYGESVATEIFTRILDPARVPHRAPYPGVVRALRDLQLSGAQVHFITHNWEPEAMVPHLTPWLREHFGEGIEVTVTTRDKLGILREIGAVGLIDDRPDTIERVADAGFWAATLVHPWNRSVAENHPKVHGFESWHEVPELLPDALRS